MTPGLLLAAALLSPSFAYDSVEFIGAFHGQSLKGPVAVAAGEGKLYVADRDANSLLMFGLKDGKGVGAVGAKTKTAEGLTYPSGVAVGKDGRVYVADTGNHRVAILDADGKWLGWFGGKGSEPGSLSSPEGVAVGPDGRVYVADTRNHRVQIYGRDGVFMLELGAPAVPMTRPTRLAVDGSENLYVLDDGGARLRRFALDGSAWTHMPIPVKGGAFALGPGGWLYTADAADGKVRQFSADGAAEGPGFGTSGKGVGQLKNPTDLSFDLEGGLLIADPGNVRVLRYRVENSKTAKLPDSRPRTKIILTGPVWSAPHKIGPFVPLKDGLFGYKLDAQELVRLDEKGAVKVQFGKRGKASGEVRDPAAIAWSTDQGVVVSDTGNDRIQLFSAEGKFTAVFGEKAGFFDSKSKEGRVNDPEGVAFGDKGNVYVADTSNARVQNFGPQGNFILTIGPKVGSVQLSQPAALEYDPKGFLYILDRGLKKIVVVEPTGKFVSAWGESGEGLSQWQEPVALAYDGHNYLYVLDRQAARLRVYDTSGRWVMNYFSRGKGEKALAEPSAIAFRDAKLYISDPARSLVTAYDVRPVLAPPSNIASEAAEGRVTLSWSGSAEPWVKQYHVERASAPGGPFEAVKLEFEKPEAADKAAAAPGVAGSTATRAVDALDTFYTTYYYRVSVEAKTGDVGPPSKDVAVYVPGSFNTPPVELSKIDLDYVFSANYKYYLKNPVGKATIDNNVEQNFKNVRLTFFLKDFMDFPSTIDVPELKGRSKTPVDLSATLNNRILEVSEDTPILAEFKVTYFEQGKEQSISRTKPVKVLGRNAIVWDQAERMSNFVTPKDPPILDFKAAALNADPKPKNAPSNLQVNNALAVWTAAGAFGAAFQPDPVNPYATLKGSADKPLDTVQFPRESLRRKSGECDDLVGLLASLFEASGIPTALLDYPAHLALMINLMTSDPVEAGLPEDRLVKHGDSLWLPVEATMLGKPFTQSLDQALSTYRKAEKKNDVRIIELAAARKTFDPVSLPPDSWKPEALDVAKVKEAFESDASKLAQIRLEFLRAYYQAMLDKDPKDSTAVVGLGIVEAQAGKSAEARKRFDEALSLDPADAAALNNLGNLSYAEGKFDEAMGAYEKARAADPHDAGILLNVARARLKAGDQKGAKQAADEASKLDESLAPIASAILELK